MSNLLTNGNFSQPTLTTNTFKYYSSNMTEEEKTSLYWTVENSSNNTMISLQNGVTSFSYANPSSISVSQFISFQFYSSIQQSVNVTVPGEYRLRFNYTCRPEYLINPLKVYINDELIYVLKRYINAWNVCTVVYNVTKSGTYTIKFLTDFMDGDTCIAIANVSFIKTNNIVNNSYFYTPRIFENTYVNVNNFYSPEMYPQFHWSYNNGTTGSITLANGTTNYDNNGIPSTDARVQQYIILQNDAYIYQNMNCPVTGNYQISCFIVASVNSSINYIKFYIDDTLVYTLTTSTLTQWSFAIVFTTNISVGSHTIKILGVNGLLAISNVEIITPSTYIPPSPAPAGPTTVSQNIFKSTKICGNFDVRPLLDTSSNIITEGISTLVPKGDTTALFVGDNNFYDTNTSYGTLSVTRPSSTQGNHQSRPHIGLIRRGRTVFQMGFCEKFTGFEDNFGMFHQSGWTLNNANPGITFKNHQPPFIGINNVNPTVQLDVSGNSLFRNNVTINGNITNTQLNNNTTNITTISGLVNTATNNITTISGRVNTATTNITTISGLVNTATNNITTINTKLTKVGYDSTRNHTIIGNTRSDYSITRSTGGALVQHEPAPIFNKTNVSDYFGNGYYFNTNSTYRTDFINYSGSATTSTNNGGFDFWVASLGFIPRNIASISESGNFIADGSITSNTSITAASYVASPYIQINNIINIGKMFLTTVSGTINLTFPITENIFCNTTSGALTLRMPNTATVSAYDTCTVNIRRVAGTNGISFTSATGNQISNSTNITVASLTDITNLNIRFFLCNNLWYFSSYA